MARIYAARQIQDGPRAGKWHMTVASDEERWCHAIGYCGENCAHDTADGARAHYDQWLVDKAEFTSLAVDAVKEQHRCDVPGCNSWAWNSGQPPGEYMYRFTLCADHLTSDGYKAALEGRHK